MHRPLQNPKYASDVNMPSQTKWRNVGWKTSTFFIQRLQTFFLNFCHVLYVFLTFYIFFWNVMVCCYADTRLCWSISVKTSRWLQNNDIIGKFQLSSTGAATGVRWETPPSDSSRKHNRSPQAWLLMGLVRRQYVRPNTTVYTDSLANRVGRMGVSQSGVGIQLTEKNF